MGAVYTGLNIPSFGPPLSRNLSEKLFWSVLKVKSVLKGKDGTMTKVSDAQAECPRAPLPARSPQNNSIRADQKRENLDHLFISQTSDKWEVSHYMTSH